MTKEEARILFEKYRQGRCTAEETALIEAWYAAASESDQRPDISERKLAHDREAILARLRATYFSDETEQPQPVRHTRKLPSYYWAAALFIVAISIALYFNSSLFVNRKSEIVNDVAPGYNQATLTLANGTKVNLDSAQSGIIIADEEIKYNNGNNVLAEKGRGPGAPGTYNVERTTYNSLTTPKGGQYQIMLEDGTKVWLNAASTLKYPNRFSGATREVFLQGEAFFEVNNNRSVGAMQANRKSYLVNRKSNTPFVVRSQNQEITVLGTSFNVSAFADDKETKTTLVEGKVQVKSQNVTLKTYNVQLLNPKQQAVVKGDNLRVSMADVAGTIAWKNHEFNFNNTPLKDIMRQLERWYDVEVVHIDQLPDKNFYGQMSRNVKLSQVLAMIQETSHLTFSIEGRRIVYQAEKK